MSLSRHPDVVKVVEGERFVEAVRLSCITLEGKGSLSDEVIRLTALTQAYPRIALVLATTVDKDYKSILPPGSISYEILYREVERLATSQPYVDDIHRIAATLTASYFIRSTPLNSSIQFLPLADKMEERAIQDLDRLRGQVLHQISGLLGGSGTPPLPAGPSFYFTGLVEDGRSTDTILIPEGTRGVAVYTLTPSYQPTPLEIAIGVPPTLPDLLSALSEGINNLSIRGGSNILASPNRGTYQVLGTDVVAGGALVRVDSITLAPRRSDPILTRELAILSFYLIPDSAPIDSWKANILETSIPSLLYGVVPSYKELHPSGPHSILLELQKGVVTKVEGMDKVDTLYLQGKGSGTITYSVSIDGVVHEGLIPISNTSITPAEQVAESLRQALGTYALVAQLGPQALQVIPNGSTPVTIALSSPPPGISTSTGTSKAPLFPYGGAITLTPTSSNVPIRRPTLAEEATGVYSATSFRMGVSPRMQAVYDRLGKVEALRRKGGGCNGRW